MLQAIEACSCHSVAQSQCGPIIEAVLAKLAKVVEVESHEGSLLQAMAVLGSWLALDKSQTPQIITAGMDKHLNLKTWTTAVRTAYFRSLRNGLSNSFQVTPAQLKPVMRAMEKALAQQQQLAIVIEALSATSYLLSLSAADPSLESHLSTVWSSALDFKRGYFTSDKFLNTATGDNLVELVNVVEVLLTYHHNRVAEHEPLLLHCLAACLCWMPHESDNTQEGKKAASVVRATARATLKKLLSSLVGEQVAPAAMKAFAKYLESAVNVEVRLELDLASSNFSWSLIFSVVIFMQ